MLVRSSNFFSEAYFSGGWPLMVKISASCGLPFLGGTARPSISSPARNRYLRMTSGDT